MTVLVTGGSGLVGARLLPRLVEAGIETRALMRAEKEVPAGIIAAAGDLLDPATLPKALEGVSAIIHLAAVFRTQDIDLVWKSNVEGTRNLIAAAKAHAPDARFIMASTGNVYNDNTPRPGEEDDDCSPERAYPASKIAAEKELRESDLNWSIQRYAFVYGDKDGHLQAVPRAAVNAKWHPAMRMSMIHHRDIATAALLGLNGTFDGRIVNIADEAPTSIYELAELGGGTVAPSSEPLVNPWFLHMNGALARRLGFQPTIRTVYQAAQKGLL